MPQNILTDIDDSIAILLCQEQRFNFSKVFLKARFQGHLCKREQIINILENS